MSTIRHQSIRSLALLQAEWILMLADCTSTSIPLSHVVHGRPQGVASSCLMICVLYNLIIHGYTLKQVYHNFALACTAVGYNRKKRNILSVWFTVGASHGYVIRTT